MFDLGTRMKRYEASAGSTLPWRQPAILRVDGRAFHTFTRKYDKPFDFRITHAMMAAATDLMQEVAGAVLAYVQSDEISILMCSDQTHTTQPWFGNKTQKIASVGASIATAGFNAAIQPASPGQKVPKAYFDARVFSIPREDVNNYFLWRQRDATRNSIQGLGQANFSHKELQGKSCNEIQELLWSQKNINWNDIPIAQKRGWCILKNGDADFGIPVFSEDPDYVNTRLLGVDYNKWSQGDSSTEDIVKMLPFLDPDRQAAILGR